MAKYEVTSGRIQAAQKVVVYGPEGVGKSTFAACFPDPVFIDTEGGTRNLDIRRLPAPAGWDMLLDEVNEVVKGNVPCGTLVVDTADWAERLCIQAVCAKLKIKGIEDAGYGKGYVYVQEEFQRLLNGLEMVAGTGKNVVLTAHAIIGSFDLPEGMGSYSRWTLKTTKKVAPVIKEWADALLFVNFKTDIQKTGSGPAAKNKATGGSKRVMYTTHHACWDAKNRWGLPDACPFEFAAIAPHIPGSGPAPDAPLVDVMALGEQAPKPAPAPQPAPAPPAPQPSAAPAKPSGNAEAEAALQAAGYPGPLRKLMLQHGVTDAALRHAVWQMGIYPADTPVSRYDPAFIDQQLVQKWPQWFEFLQKNADVPF